MKALANPDALARTAARLIATSMRSAIRRRGSALVALAGGQTPIRTYEILGMQSIDWNRVDAVLTDERCVPLNDVGSNYRMVRSALRVPGATRHPLHAVNTLASPQDGARQYEQKLRCLIADRDPPDPLLDVVVLGLGSDGHTASLFDVDSGHEERWVVPTRTPTGQDRVTMTPTLLNRAGMVLIVVAGIEKQRILATYVSKSNRLPIDRLQPSTHAFWLLADVDAAGKTVGTKGT